MVAIKIMSFNIAAETLCIDNNSKNIIHIIQTINPDILGIQETNCHNEQTNEYNDIKLYKDIAKELNYYYKTNEITHTVIFSKFPIIHVSELYKGIVIKYNDDIISIFNIHLTDEPYQPYQIAKIPYGDYPFIETEENAIKYATKAREAEITKILSEITQINNLYNPSSIIVLGDFNEPSHRDWTIETVKAKMHPFKVNFPSVKSFESYGFIDSFRHIYPDPVKTNGFTWPTPNKYLDSEILEDRIDFILIKTTNMNIINADIIGESQFEKWSSDHRACICVLEKNNYYQKYIKYKNKYMDLKKTYIYF